MNYAQSRRFQRYSVNWRGCGLSLAVAALTVAAAAGPQGGEIVDGQGNIGRAGNGTTVINQLTERLAIDWDSFNVSSDERVVFQQPSSSSTALNRIFDQNPSQIFGAIDANGQILLINPNGILFGETAQLNLQSLVATSLDLSLDDFKAGHYNLEALASSRGAAIVNRGLIQAATGGSVSLIGDTVSNEGFIVADYGQVNLASGRGAAIDFDGDGMLLFSLDAAVTENPSGVASAVANTGRIQANGGQVLLSANAARDVFDSVVNNTGSVRAMRVDNSGGVIRLTGNGGTVLNTGDLDASSTTGQGGEIVVEGGRVGIAGQARLNASGRDGGGSINVGGGLQGGDRFIENADYTFVGAATSMRADAQGAGDGGEVIVWSDVGTKVYGEISARGGLAGGDGGFVETSGKQGLEVLSVPDVTAARGAGGEWLIDPFNIDIVPAATGTTGIDSTDPVDLFPDESVGTAELGVDLILAALTGGATVIIRTTAGGDPLDLGDITLTAGTTLDFEGTGTNTLVLEAINDIVIEGSILDSVGSGDVNGDRLDLTLDAGGDVSVSAAGVVDLGTDGILTVDGVSFSNDSAAVDADGGIVMNLTGTFGNAGNLVSSGAASVAITLDGEFTNTGTIDADTGAFALTASAAADSVINLGGTITGVGNTVTTSGNNDTVNIDANITADVVTGAGDDAVNVNAALSGNVTTEGGVDTVTVAAGGSVTGNVSAGAGADIANLAGSIGGSLLMGADNDAINIVDSGSAGSYSGGSEDDTLTGANNANDWTVDGVNSGTLNGVNFTFVENLVGGSNADDFVIDNAVDGDIDGGDGVDTFLVGAAGGANELIGGNAADVLSAENDAAAHSWLVSGANSGVLDGVAFSGMDDLQGSENVDTFTLQAAGLVGNLDGNGGVDELIGPDADATWTVSSADAGSVGAQGFVEIENLTGRTGIDTFNVNAGLTGNINAGEGADLLNIDAAVGGDVNGEAGNDVFTISDAGTSGSAFDGGDDTDTLIGDAAGSDFAILGANNGQVDSKPFVGFDIVTGGAGVDTFTVSGGFLGALNGGGNNDSFVIDVGGSAVSYNGDGGTADVLTGPDQNNTWNVDGDNEGTLNGVAFTGVESLVGNDSNDTFTIEVTGNVDNISGGAGGANSLTGPDAGVDVGWAITSNTGGTLELPSAVDVLFFDNVQTLTGGSGVDLFTLIAAFTGDLNGGGGNDVFALNAALTGDINAGTGDDRIALGTGGSATNYNGGGGTGDSLVVDISGGMWEIDGLDTGSLDGNAYSGMENLVGGEGDDQFNVTSSAFAGTIDGDLGDDIITLEVLAPNATFDGGGGDDAIIASVTDSHVWLIDNANEGELDGASFTDIESLISGDMNDTFTFDVDGTIDALDGGDGVDTLIAADRANTFTITDDNEGEFNGASFLGIEELVGGALQDTFTIIDGAVSVLSGGGGLDDEIIGPDLDADWEVDVNDGGSVTFVGNGGSVTQAFSNVENITGSGGIDEFLLSAALTGFVSGGLGNDLIEVEVTGGAGGYDGGDGVLDTLQFMGNVARTWMVDTLGGGMVDGVLFAGVENAVGGEGTDAVTFGVDGELTLFDGGDGNDSLTAANETSSFDITVDDGGELLRVTMFENVENLNGGDQGDFFTFTANLTGTANGGAGDDIFILSSGGAALIDGGAGDGDTFQGPDADLMITVDNPNEFEISGANVTVNSNVNIERIAGGAGNDEFVFNSDTSQTFDGGAGNDTFTLTAGIVGGSLLGGSGNDEFDLNGGSLDGNADGQVGNDIFRLNAGTHAGSLLGNGGNDSFVVDALFAGSGGTLTGLIDGGVDEQDTLSHDAPGTWQIDGPSSGTVDAIAFAGIDEAVGSTGADTFTFDLLGQIDLINAGDGDDTLTAADTVNTIVIDQINGGNLNTTTTVFSGIDELVGGSDIDTFVLQGAGSVALIDGGAGSVFDILQGTDQEVAWVVDAPDAGQVGMQEFVSIESLIGGSDIDMFTIDAALSGSISAGGGNDTINLNAAVGMTVDGGAGEDSTIVGMNGGATFYDGGADADTLTAAGTGNRMWTIDGANSGTLDTNLFANTEALVGGAADDQFDVQTDGSVASIDGGGSGTEGNTLVGDDAGNAFTVSATDSGTLDGLAFENIQNLTGGAMRDTFVFNAMLTGSAVGLDGQDVFSLGDMGGAASLDGGGDSDTLNGRNADATWTINAANAGDVNGQNFIDIESLNGGGMVDTFVVDATIDGDIAAGAGNDIFNIAVGFDGTFDGGADMDTFNLLANVTNIAGVLEGGAGDDTLVGFDTANDWLVSATNEGMVNGVVFSDLENLTGGNAVDMMTINAGVTGVVNAGAGADVITVAGNTQAGARSILGGSGDDMLTITALPGGVDVDFDGGADRDTVVIVGGSAAQRLSGVYTASSETLTYSSTGGTYSAELSNAETIDDQVFATTLQLLTDGSGDVSLTGGGMAGDARVDYFGLVYEFSNKESLDLDATGAQVSLVEEISLTGFLDIDGDSLVSDGSLISVGALIVQNAVIMSALNTSINSLTLTGVSGSFDVNDTDELTLLSSIIEGVDSVVNVTTAGDLTIAASESVQSAGALGLNATGGSIDVDGALAGNTLVLDSADDMTINGMLTGVQSVALTSDGAIGQSAAGAIVAPMLTTTSGSGLALAGTGNRFGAITATNAEGNMIIVNGIATIATLANGDGALSLSNDGDLSVVALTNSGGATTVEAQGDLALNGNVNTSGAAPTLLSAQDALSQIADVDTQGDLTISANTVAVSDAASSTSTNGNVTYQGVGTVTVNDISAVNGTVVVASDTGAVLAAQAGSAVTSDDITFSSLLEIGTQERSFAVFGTDGVLNLTSPDGRNKAAPPFVVEQPGVFDRIGVRGASAIDLAVQESNAIFAQGQSATLDNVTTIDANAFETELEVVGKVGRGVAIPCGQVEDEEEACQ